MRGNTLLAFCNHFTLHTGTSFMSVFFEDLSWFANILSFVIFLFAGDSPFLTNRCIAGFNHALYSFMKLTQSCFSSSCMLYLNGVRVTC
jgi:hypothetical protein